MKKNKEKLILKARDVMMINNILAPEEKKKLL